MNGINKHYSDDRKSICQEIAEGLQKGGFWIPSDINGPDLITAIFRAIQSLQTQVEEVRQERDKYKTVILDEITEWASMKGVFIRDGRFENIIKELDIHIYELKKILKSSTPISEKKK